MMRLKLSRAVPIMAVSLALAGCDAGPVDTGRAGFKANYLVARVALERGEHQKAARHYKALLKKSGPLQPRIRLEYAHALLREGKYDKAADEARMVAADLSGPGRAAALAVQGTAEHEQARAAIAKGRTGKREILLLQSAKLALTEMLALSPDLDPTGGMQKRAEQIALELQALL